MHFNLQTKQMQFHRQFEKFGACQQRKTECKKKQQQANKKKQNKEDESCRGKIDNHNLYHEFEQSFTVSL